MNRVCFIGRITKEPVLRKTGSGMSVVYFTLAVERRIKGTDGQDADFPNCVAFKNPAEIICRYVKKGDKIAVDGRLQTRIKENIAGEKTHFTEIVVENVTLIQPKENYTMTEVEISQQNIERREMMRQEKEQIEKENRDAQKYDYDVNGVAITTDDLPF